MVSGEARMLSRNVGRENTNGRYSSQLIVTANIGIGAKYTGRIMVDCNVNMLLLKKVDHLFTIVAGQGVIAACQGKV